MQRCSMAPIGLIVAILVGIVLIAGLVFVLWVLPIMLGIKQARTKNYSPAWMWFGVHPLFGWIMFTILACLRPRIRCGSCGGFVQDNFVKCPFCHEAVVPSRGQESPPRSA